MTSDGQNVTFSADYSANYVAGVEEWRRQQR